MDGTYGTPATNPVTAHQSRTFRVSLGLMSLVLVFPRLSQAPPRELTCAVVGFDPDGVWKLVMSWTAPVSTAARSRALEVQSFRTGNPQPASDDNELRLRAAPPGRDSSVSRPGSPSSR